MHGSTTRVICFINTKKYEWINILEYYQGNKNKGIIFSCKYESADLEKIKAHYK